MESDVRTLFIPAAGTWSFAPQEPPATWVPGADGGIIYLEAVTDGSSPVDGDGVIFTVTLDGGVPYVSACMENGQDTVIVPPGTVLIEITAAFGCNAGVDPTMASCWAVST